MPISARQGDGSSARTYHDVAVAASEFSGIDEIRLNLVRPQSAVRDAVAAA
jgi:hypothetical protein